MAEARKTFPMSTFVAYVKGEGKDAQKQNINDLLCFMTKKDINDEFAPFASALAKAWIYEQHPELARMKTGDVAALGDNVSLSELPAPVLLEVDAVFAKLAAYSKTVADQAAKVAELEKGYAETSAKLKETEKQLAEYKGKCEKLEASAKSQGDKLVVAAEEKVASLSEKVTGLFDEVEKVKSSIIAILKAAPTGGAAAAGGEEAGAGAPEVGGEPTPDFGFGSDPFSDSKW